jgi:hypothetical protein
LGSFSKLLDNSLKRRKTHLAFPCDHEALQSAPTEVDGTPLVLDHNLSAPEEVLMLLSHADGHRLQKDELTRQAKNNTGSSVGVAISRLTKTNEIRSTGTPGELAITPKGQKRVIEKIIPKLKA